MIRQLRLMNFKAFENQLFEFRPLTLLSGLNSTGKSSVIQSLLLLRQSYQQELLKELGLALNGDLVRIGNAQDAFYEAAKEDYGQIELKVVIKALLELQNCCKNWNEGYFSVQGYALEESGESEPTLNKYRQERIFVCPDGKERLFERHIKLRLCNWRIHFIAEKPGKLIIGYIGRHLPTVNYRT